MQFYDIAFIRFTQKNKYNPWFIYIFLLPLPNHSKLYVMNYFKLSLSLILSIFVLQSCSSDELRIRGTHWTEDAVRSSLKFVRISKGSNHTRSIEEVEDNNLSIILGRPSKRCRGFGICEISKPY